MLVEHHAVETFSGLSDSDIVSENMIDEAHGIRPLDPHLAHVTHIENTAGIAHCIMFLDDSFILYRHVESPEWRHKRTEPDVARVEAGRFVFLCFHHYI